MFNFLSEVLKNKKVFFCVFLFLAIGGIIAPQVTYAGFWCTVSSVVGGPAADLWGCGPITAISSTVKEVAEKGAESVGDSILNDLIYAVGYIITTITSGLMGLAAGTLKWILDYQNAFTITRDNNVVTVGWNSVRDLANMFIVLGFVIIGIAFTLRLEGYGSKKTLINLIMIALLINFSLVICGIFIDGANKAVDFFLQGSNVLPETFIEGITKQLDVLGGAFSKDDPVNTLGIATQFAFYNIVAFIVFLLFAFLFLFRLVALMILVILAPLAFVSYVFPFTKNMAQMWWSNFFQWCIIGIPGSFFLYLADLLTKQANITEASDPMLFLLPGFFLIVGFLFSLKMAPMGASAVTGLAKGTIGFATGAIAGGAAVAAKGGMAGLNALSGGRASAATERISSGVGRAMDYLGIAGRKRGMTAQNYQKDMKETIDRVGSMDEMTKTRIATSGANTPQGRRDKIAAIQDKIKNGKISDLGNAAQQSRAIALVESYTRGRGGVSTIRKDALKLNPNIAANSAELRSAVQNQNPGDFAKNIDSSAITAAVLGATDDRQLTILANRGSKTKKDAMRNLVRTAAGRAQIRAHASTLNPAERAEFARNIRLARTLFR